MNSRSNDCISTIDKKSKKKLSQCIDSESSLKQSFPNLKSGTRILELILDSSLNEHVVQTENLNTQIN